MKIQDLLNQYDFHDSTLEQLSVDETAHTVSIDLYFCNWLQSYFTPDLPKNIQVRLLFQGVRSFKKENLDMDEPSGNEILETEMVEDGLFGTGIHFLLYNWNMDDDTHIYIYAENVEFIILPQEEG